MLMACQKLLYVFYLQLDAVVAAFSMFLDVVRKVKKKKLTMR